MYLNIAAKRKWIAFREPFYKKLYWTILPSIAHQYK